MNEEQSGYKLLGQGYNVLVLGKVEGAARNLTRPQDVVGLLANSEAVKGTIIITPGGTTTFVAPLLSAGVKGVVTFAGTPESHLGIVGRNFRIPIVMSLQMEEGATIPDGTHLMLDCTGKVGRVYARV